mgnify:CR=1 FL=1
MLERAEHHDDPADSRNTRREPDGGSGGAGGATDELFEVVYQQLRGLAHRRMSHEHEERSLQTTALVHEVYLRLRHDPGVRWNSPGHFFGAAAEAMRRILIERARRRATLKRGGDRVRERFDDAETPGGLTLDDAADGMLELDGALQQLEALDPGLAQVVKLRYFAGLSVEETAAAMDRSPRSIKRDWAFARAWLARALQG